MQFKNIRVKGLPKPIKISDTGIVYYNGRMINTHIIKGKNHTKGFVCCSISGVPLYLHRLIADAFVKNPKPVTYKMVSHKDGDTLNNSPDNLAWGDAKIMYRHRVNAGVPGAGVSHHDEKYRGSSKISYEEAIKVAERLDNGETAVAIAKEFNVSEMSIIRIRKRYCKKKIASPRYSKEIKETVLRLLLDHERKDVAKITGIRYETVRRWDIASRVDC